MATKLPLKTGAVGMIPFFRPTVFARSPSMAHGRKRKRLPLVVNFSKLFPEDELYVQVDGTRKLAIVKIIDPFLQTNV